MGLYIFGPTEEAVHAWARSNNLRHGAHYRVAFCPEQLRIRQRSAGCKFCGLRIIVLRKMLGSYALLKMAEAAEEIGAELELVD